MEREKKNGVKKKQKRKREVMTKVSHRQQQQQPNQIGATRQTEVFRSSNRQFFSFEEATCSCVAFPPKTNHTTFTSPIFTPTLASHQETRARRHHEWHAHQQLLCGCAPHPACWAWPARQGPYAVRPPLLLFVCLLVFVFCFCSLCPFLVCCCDTTQRRKAHARPTRWRGPSRKPLLRG